LKSRALAIRFLDSGSGGKKRKPSISSRSGVGSRPGLGVDGGLCDCGASGTRGGTLNRPRVGFGGEVILADVLACCFEYEVERREEVEYEVLASALRDKRRPGFLLYSSPVLLSESTARLVAQ